MAWNITKKIRLNRFEFSYIRYSVRDGNDVYFVKKNSPCNEADKIQLVHIDHT